MWVVCGSTLLVLILVLAADVLTLFAGTGASPGSMRALPHGGNQTTVANLPPLVFVSRNPLSEHIHIDPGAVPGIGPQYRTAKVGGKLMARERNGRLRILVDEVLLYDVADPSVSWDGQTIVFAGVEHPDSSWRLFRIGADGKNFKQITFTDRTMDLEQFGAAAVHFRYYDDFDPCFMPDGRIIFASTRYPALASLDQVLVSNLYMWEKDGSIHRVTTERNSAEEPTIDPVTGLIVYSRWWVNLDRPSNVTRHGLARSDHQSLTDDIGNIWQAVTVRPDGGGLKMYAGFPKTKFGSQTYKPVVLEDGRLLSTFTARTSMTPIVGGLGLRWFNKGADFEHHIIGVRSDESLRAMETIPPPFATDPVQISGQIILFSYSLDGTDYGLYTCRLDGSELRKVLDLRGTLELDAQVLQPRRLPPVVEDEFLPPVTDVPPTEDPLTYAKNDFFRFDCMNVFANGAVDEPMPDAPRITRNAKIRFFMNIQRQNPRGPDPTIFLKDAPVFLTGGVHEHDVPAEVSLFEQLVDSTGKVLETTDGKFAHVPGFNYERQGAGTKCVGCHAGHSMLTVPINGTLAEWVNVSPSATVTASSFFVDERGRSFHARRAVDRQAQMGGDTVNWVANEGSGAHLDLQWEIPIDVKRFVLYGIKPNVRSGNTTVVQKCEIYLYRNSVEVGRTNVLAVLSAAGTQVNIPPTTIDAARVVVTRFDGTFGHRPLAGLAEVETIARIYQEPLSSQ